MAESIASQWKKLQQGIYNAVYRESLDAMEKQTNKICLMFADIINSNNLPAMTGNSATGLAVGLYRDGELLMYSTMMNAGERHPVSHVLRKGEKFEEGSLRYDDAIQNKTFSVGSSGANTPYMAWVRAVGTIRRAKPSFKGYSFVVAHGAHYIRYNGYDDAVAQLYAELKTVGAKLITIKMRNT